MRNTLQVPDNLFDPKTRLVRSEPEAVGTVSGAVFGAATGALAGPGAAVAGALVGGIVGAITSYLAEEERSESEANERALELERYRAAGRPLTLHDHRG